MVATISGKSFSGPDVLNAVAGKVTDYPLKFLPLSEGADEVVAARTLLDSVQVFAPVYADSLY